jgi:ElaB/YqjD/DUF883 family membrane-anchored ribosome-binding protein
MVAYPEYDSVESGPGLDCRSNGLLMANAKTPIIQPRGDNSRFMPGAKIGICRRTESHGGGVPSVLLGPACNRAHTHLVCVIRQGGAAYRRTAASDLEGGDEMEKSVVDQVAKTLVDQANNVGENFRKASEFTSNVADSVHDGMKAAKHAVKDGRDAVEDFIDDTARSVKRSPIQSVLISLLVGLSVGFLFGRGTSRK